MSLLLIRQRCFRRALELEGAAAIDVEEEDEISLKPKWSVAAEHLLNTAISYESYSLLTEAEKAQLRKPVLEVFEI